MKTSQERKMLLLNQREGFGPKHQGGLGELRNNVRYREEEQKVISMFFSLDGSLKAGWRRARTGYCVAE
jgi:hypothetical protein